MTKTFFKFSQDESRAIQSVILADGFGLGYTASAAIIRDSLLVRLIAPSISRAVIDKLEIAIARRAVADNVLTPQVAEMTSKAYARYQKKRRLPRKAIPARSNQWHGRNSC